MYRAGDAMQIDRTLMEYCVYKHTFPNKKVYIGITAQNPIKRWANGFGYKKQPYIYNAICKYGWNNIIHEILYSGLSKECAEKTEIELITVYKSNRREYGYNVANGGNTIGSVSDETRKKISSSLKGIPKERSPFKGKKHRPESKIKLSNKRKGKLNPMYGRQLSDETKTKMRSSHINGALCKSIKCLETGEIFVSASDVARKMNLSQGNVSSVARGEREHTKGFHFMYINKEVTH